jgi:hypothetical protein
VTLCGRGSSSPQWPRRACGTGILAFWIPRGIALGFLLLGLLAPRVSEPLNLPWFRLSMLIYRIAKSCGNAAHVCPRHLCRPGSSCRRCRPSASLGKRDREPHRPPQRLDEGSILKPSKARSRRLTGVGEWTASVSIGKAMKFAGRTRSGYSIPPSPYIGQGQFGRIQGDGSRALGRRHADLILDKLIDVKEDGSSLAIQLRHRSDHDEREVPRSFGGAPRDPDSPLTLSGALYGSRQAGLGITPKLRAFLKVTWCTRLISITSFPNSRASVAMTGSA